MKKLILLLLLIFIGCSEDSCEPNPILSTNEVSNITDSSVTLSGSINPPTCDLSVTSQGFVFGKNNLPTINDNKVIKSGTSISSNITGLEQNTYYYTRTFFENPSGVYYGNEIEFKTSVGNIEFLQSSYSNVTPISAVVSFTGKTNGGGTISESGIVYSSNPNPTIDNNKKVATDFYGSFNLEDLKPETTYYFKPYGINEIGLFYGDEISFTTKDGIVEFDLSFSKIKKDGFEYNFNLEDDGGYGNLITSKGLYFSETNNPTNLSIKKLSNGELTGLETNTIYYAFPFYVIKENLEYVLEPVELKTAPENIFTEVRRVKFTLESYNNNGYYGMTGIDADVFFDSKLKYIDRAILELSYAPNGGDYKSPTSWWIFWEDGTNYAQSYLDNIEVSTDGTLIKEIGKGSTSSRNIYINYEYRVRVLLYDFSNNIYYSDYVKVDVQ